MKEPWKQTAFIDPEEEDDGRNEHLPPGLHVVLTHGAWTDGSCLKDVVLPLEQLRLPVISVPIRLLLLRRRFALTRSLERSSRPVVFIGHAQEGEMIGAVRDEGVKASFISQGLHPMKMSPSRSVVSDEPHTEAPIRRGRRGFIWMPEEDVPEPLPTELRLTSRVSSLQSIVRFISLHPGASAGAGIEAETVLVSACGTGSHDRSRNSAIMAHRMGAKIGSISADHSPMYSATDRVIDVIVGDNARMRLSPKQASPAKWRMPKGEAIVNGILERFSRINTI